MLYFWGICKMVPPLWKTESEHKGKYASTQQFCSYVYAWEKGKQAPTKDLNKNVHAAWFKKAGNSVSINKTMNKQIVFHNGVLILHRKWTLHAGNSMAKCQPLC